MNTYEVTITKKVEEVIIIKSGDKGEAMSAAIGASKAQNVTDICVKNIKQIKK